MRDFQTGRDHIALGARDLPGLAALRQTGTFHQGDAGGVLDLTAYSGGIITLKGILLSDLDSDDFLF